MPGYRGFELKKYDKDLTEAIGRALPTLKEDKEFMDGYKTCCNRVQNLLLLLYEKTLRKMWKSKDSRKFLYKRQKNWLKKDRM